MRRIRVSITALLVGTLALVTMLSGIGLQPWQNVQGQTAPGTSGLPTIFITEDEEMFGYDFEGEFIDDEQFDFEPGDGFNGHEALAAGYVSRNGANNPSFNVVAADVDTGFAFLGISSIDASTVGFFTHVGFNEPDALLVANVEDSNDAASGSLEEVLVAQDDSGVVDIYHYDDSVSGNPFVQLGSVDAGYSSSGGIVTADIVGVSDAGVIPIVSTATDGVDEILTIDRDAGVIGVHTTADAPLEDADLDVSIDPDDGIAAGNLNGHGADDLVVADASNGTVHVLEYVRDQRAFQTLASFFGNFGPNDGIALTDVDGNRTDEILVADADSGEVTVFRYNITGEGGNDFFTEGSFDVGFGPDARFDVVDFRYTDSDGDSLFDHWEESGVDGDGDGVIDVNLPNLDADPRKADIFVEIDCLVSDGNNNGQLNDSDDHSHCPQQAAMEDVVRAFANAPVRNPDGTFGIQLHVDTGPLYGAGIVHTVTGADGVNGTYGDLGGGGDQIDEDGNEVVNFHAATGDPGTNFYDLKEDNFDAGRAPVFRYALFVHQLASNDCSGGVAEGIPGNDFLVSLGGKNCGWTDDINGFSVGSRDEQAGTFMHELGHTLGLQHGGGDPVNRKPNYLSVMSYAFQDCRVPAGPVGAEPALPGGCDFSRNGLDKLVEELPPGLDECQGVDAGLYGLGPVDFDGDGNIDGETNCDPPNDENVSVDIDGDGDADDTLEGFDDWANLRFEFQTLRFFANGVASPVEDEATPEDIEEAQEFMDDLLTPDLSISKSDSDDPAVAGEELTYTLTVTNHGPTAAEQVEVVDTLPAGVSYVSDDAGCAAIDEVVTCDLGQLPVQDAENVSITVLIDPALVAENGGPVTISNTVSVANLDENADESITDNNSATEETLVEAEADLAITSFAATDAAREIVIGEPIEVTLDKVVTNHGPSGPVDATVAASVAGLDPDDGGLTVEPDPANPGQVLALGINEQRSLTESFTITCLEPGSYTVTFTNAIAPLNADDTDPNPANNEAVAEVTVECAVPVALNVKPGDFPNTFNLGGGGGTIPVAVLTTEAGEHDLPVAIDATEIDPLSVRFGPPEVVFDVGAPGGASEIHDRGHLEDSYELDEVTRDGDTDLVLHFEAHATDLDGTDTEACVRGTLTTAGGGSVTFFGCDSIEIRPRN